MKKIKRWIVAFVDDEIFSSWDMLLGLFIVAAAIGFKNGTGHPWAIVPIIALWVVGRLIVRAYAAGAD